MWTVKKSLHGIEPEGHHLIHLAVLLEMGLGQLVLSLPSTQSVTLARLRPNTFQHTTHTCISFEDP